jgi:hypothetical protein
MKPHEFNVTQRDDRRRSTLDKHNRDGCDLRWYAREEWRKDGLLHRHWGAAVSVTNPINGIVVQEEFYRNGVLSRFHGPAYIERHVYTGEITVARFFERGREVVPHYGPESWDPL